MKKTMLKLLVMCMILTVMKESLMESMTMKMSTMVMGDMALPSMNLSVMIEETSKNFLIMVMTITTVVISYGETYMSDYNMKKFLFLTMTFFMSMITLSLSESFMMTMLGWEFLGISSLLLIMFYPHKTSMKNSEMTMFFNRVGDSMLLVILSMSLIGMKTQLTNQEPESWSNGMMMLILACSLTKSAQIPMSSWLPAAMSAPTPISAMVHSSTLVTAGIFLNMKLSKPMMEESLNTILMTISLSTFLLGGLLANVEMDMKKVIAFSTMSQISMIMMMVSINNMKLATLHMMAHALFKTTLFCSFGFMFLKMLSNQSKKGMNQSKSDLKMTLLIFTSIYSMTGMTMSTSYFTKDNMMEINLETQKQSSNTILLMCALLTMMYCSKIMNKTKSSFSMKSSMIMMEKKTKGIYIMTMIMTLLAESQEFISIKSSSTPNISLSELMMMNMMMIIPLILSLTSKKSTSLMSSSVMFMKEFSFNQSKEMMTKMMKETTTSDTWMLKNHYFKKKLSKKEPMTSKKTFMWMMIKIMILIKMTS